MYVTRPLSMYRKSPSTLEMKPPDGPYSGLLVVTDEEADAQDTFCWGQSWGLCKRKNVKKLPFPQDKILTIVYTSEYHETTTTNVWFIPVPDQPLSSNCYYVIRAKGRHKGKACTCSREGDIMSCCFRDISRDKKPKPLNFKDIYQQVKIYHHHSGGFFAKSVAPDGLPPKFLRRKGWKVRCSSLNRLRLSEALGLDTSLRAQLPSFNFPIFNFRSPSLVVGKWHCPFPFVRDRTTRPKTQMKKSIFYTLTLEQWWEEIFSRGNVDNSQENTVTVNEYVEREVYLVAGMEAVRENRRGHGGFSWFKVYNPNGRRGVLSVGLSSAIVEHMGWILEEGGWVSGGESEVKVERVEENNSGGNRWRKFGCYVLVESFSLRRLDGSMVLKCSFRHTQRIKCKWE
ncbi:hypothetical protein TorRG33x02_327760 [Trema orientale]|uniref:Uncharacterized protein n=1 Tax=Trema orientale TaxID=63057 RepID=A0A2P5BAP2_TREOI|nr:hypothetical protein TorRG33x02_327760 [Trema orientale]